MWKIKELKKNRNRSCSFMAAVLLACLPGLSCDKPVGADESDGLTYSGSWSSGWPELGHDGHTLETEHFIVFSNHASDESREYAAALAEDAFTSTKTLLTVADTDLTWLQSYEVHKIHIFVDYDQSSSDGLAYRDGIIVRSSDSPRFRYTPDQYRHIVHHEINHVFEFLLIGSYPFRQFNSVWLREGFGDYAAGKHDVTTVAQLESWIAQTAGVEGMGNPIGIRVWSDFPPAYSAPGQSGLYYKMFELATRYLLDPLGQGKTVDDLKAFYDEMGTGVLFAEAFEHHFGLTAEYYEENFFDLAATYLEKYEVQARQGTSRGEGRAGVAAFRTGCF